MFKGNTAMKTIYERLGALHNTISKNPELCNLIGLAWMETLNLNPASRNLRFRQLFESYEVEYHKQGYSYSEIYYRTVNNDWVEHCCHTCRKHIDSEKYTKIYCCAKCAANNPKTLETRIATTQSRYGVNNVFQAEKVKETIKETSLDKYGTERFQQSGEFSTKLKNTIANYTDEKREKIIQKRSDTYMRRYGVDHCSKIPEVRKKTKDTNLIRYGVENPNQLEEVREKAKQTNLQRYGVENPSQSSDIKEKVKQTTFERYGVENGSQSPIIKEKMKQTNLQRYGVENVFQAHTIKEQIKQTNVEIHGVEYQSQRAEIQEKKWNRTNKTYTFPSGNSYRVQGNEPLAINMLLESGYSESQIDLKNRPSIKYFWSHSDGYGDDKWHIYFPDIFLPNENKILEIKSSWTYDGNGSKPDWLSKNLAKKEGTVLAGYSFQFWIID